MAGEKTMMEEEEEGVVNTGRAIDLCERSRAWKEKSMRT